MAVNKAIELGDMVGAQLVGLLEAEVEAAEKAAEYIETVGFERKRDGTLELKTVTFEMRRRGVDDRFHTHTVKVPVLTLVPIPLLTIEEATIEFELQIEDIKSVESKSEEDANSGRGGISRLLGTKKRSKLVGRLARTTRQDTSSKSDLKLTVRIAQSAFPSGIERLLGAADLSVEDDSND